MAYDRFGRDQHYDRGGYRDFDEERRRRRAHYGPETGYDRDERGFFDRASDEVRSWFGDDDADRRRRLDERYDERDEHRDRYYGDYSRRWAEHDFDRARDRMRANPFNQGRGYDPDALLERDRRTPTGRARRTLPDDHYRSWRDRQMEAFDRDYDDYRRERQGVFDSDFGSWRTTRQQQRDSLGKVREHMDVVGSDGEHVGTVDHVRGDHIKLTRSDSEAGGHHHSIPCGWVSSVDTKVTLNRPANEAKAGWRDEDAQEDDEGRGPHILNRSFAGTY